MADSSPPPVATVRIGLDRGDGFHPVGAITAGSPMSADLIAATLRAVANDLEADPDFWRKHETG